MLLKTRNLPCHLGFLEQPPHCVKYHPTPFRQALTRGTFEEEPPESLPIASCLLQDENIAELIKE